MTMRQNGTQIAHGSRGDEESGGLIEEGGGVSFEGEDGGVFGEDVVSGGGAEDGLEHGRGGGGEGVGAEIGYFAVVVVVLGERGERGRSFYRCGCSSCCSGSFGGWEGGRSGDLAGGWDVIVGNGFSCQVVVLAVGRGSSVNRARKKLFQIAAAPTVASRQSYDLRR